MAGKSGIWRNAHWMLLVMAALFIRAAVPQGYMAQQASGGGIEISICNSDEAWTIPMKDDGAGKHGDGKDAGAACVFAGHHAPLVPADANLSLPLPQLAQARYDGVRQRALSPTSPSSLPPSTGPPLTV